MHRITISFSDEEWQKIEEFRRSQPIKPSAAAVVRHIVEKAALTAPKMPPTSFGAISTKRTTSPKVSEEPEPEPLDDDDLDDEGQVLAQPLTHS